MMGQTSIYIIKRDRKKYVFISVRRARIAFGIPFSAFQDPKEHRRGGRKRNGRQETKAILNYNLSRGKGKGKMINSYNEKNNHVYAPF